MSDNNTNDIPYTPVDTTLGVPISNLQETSTTTLEINAEEQYQAQIVSQQTHRLAALVVYGLPLTNAARSIGMRFAEAKTISRSIEYKTEVLRLLSLAREEAMAGAISTKAGRLSEINNMAEDIRTIKDRRADACDIRNMPQDEAWWTRQGFQYTEVMHLEGLGENYDPNSPVNPTLIPTSISAPGADTGLLTREFKVIGRGLDTRTVEEWKIDPTIQKSILELHERAARELGQWTNKQEVEFTQKMYVGIQVENI